MTEKYSISETLQLEREHYAKVLDKEAAESVREAGEDFLIHAY